MGGAMRFRHLQRAGAAVGFGNSGRGRCRRRVVWSTLPQEEVSVRVSARARYKISPEAAVSAVRHGLQLISRDHDLLRHVAYPRH